MYKKIINLVIIFGLLISGGVFAGEFSSGKCSSDLKMTQNLKAPKTGERYVKNGRYHWYTKTMVKEAHILQKHLNRLGFNAGKVDGIIGPNTKGAILRMQKFLGAKQDGYVGPKTRALLNNSCGDDTSAVVKYSGDLKIMYGENSIVNFIKKGKRYEKGYFGENISFSENDNILKEAGLINFSEDMVLNTPSVESKMVVDGGGNFSKTNIQVEGVDEADMVKTDGRYIYSLTGGKIYIVDTEDKKAEYKMKTVAKIIPEAQENIKEMFLVDKKLILISNYWKQDRKKQNKIDRKIAIYPYYRNQNFTRIEIYDISNPEKPKKEKQVDFEGDYLESRVSNNHLYFVTNKNIFDNYSIMPVVKIDGVDRTKVFGSSCYYIDAPFRNYNITSISSLNLNNLSDISSKRILMSRVQKIYMSKNNLYITYNKYIDWRSVYGELDEKIKDLLEKREEELDNKNINILAGGIVDFVFEEVEINEIEISLNDNLSASVKNDSVRKLTQKELSENKKELLRKKKEIDKKFEEDIKKIVEEFYKKHKNDFEKTKIEKFSLNGTKISSKAGGEVSGFLLNQFSMHEDKDENFFVATTNNQRWLPWQLRRYISNEKIDRLESSNNLFSLDKNLNNLDSLENLAKGERIKSVRFVKNNAYLVTFKQIDPLFNINITNPKKLRMLGKLKIDGFSSYLHPIFKDRLIGLGQEVYTDKYNNQRNGGIKITLFDVSNDKPKEIKTIIIGGPGSYSLAQNNHKAVFLDEDKNTMAFPATVITKYGKKYFETNKENKVIVLKINKDNLSLENGMDFDRGWNNRPQRVLRIKNNLFGIAPNTIKSYSLGEMEESGKFYFDEDMDEKKYPVVY